MVMNDTRWILPWEVEYLKKGVRISGTDLVVAEEPLRIEVKGQPVATLMRLPGNEVELAVGFCISEGYIKKYGDILEVKTVGDNPVKCVRIKISEMPDGVDVSSMLVIRSGCGRHNAFDKLIGYSYMNSVNLEDRTVFLTGRISSDIVIKAVRCGIPILISMLMPTSFACEIVRKFNLTLVGFARGSRANIYSANHRIRSYE